MKIETAVKLLMKEYERAKTLEWVRNPVAWALYQVWRKADEEKLQRKRRTKNERTDQLS